MNYATIKTHDVANGPGVRVSLFVSGCRHHCKGCFNSETWDFEYGKPFTEEVVEKLLEDLSPEYIKGFSLLGGEPFEPENQKVLCNVLERIKLAYPEKTIWCYSGYDFERHMLAGKLGDWEITKRMLNCIDILVDGEFVEALKNPSLRFKGSSNQRIIDVQKSLAADELVFWDEAEK
ncbi:MAG: anaerobic ribonucleoside-triphosphate reductase activating protein [Lachnospiraceae bacterium]|nr:anaerobic ribonucleoside-triphosphate reductase activating protein [Lachnospiraceae bacterium]